MNKDQNRLLPQSEIKKIAVSFAYDNFPELKQHRVEINTQDCSVTRVIHGQQRVGPGEAIGMILSDEEWEVTIPLEVFSFCLIITVYRYNNGDLDVTGCQPIPLS